MHNRLLATGLSTTHLWFTVRAVTPLELNDASGSALRGSFFDAIWQRFCTNKPAPSCAACPLHTLCPVSAIVAPLREENPTGQDIPRPYVLIPPLDGARRYLPNETFSFGMTLIGSIVQLLPYILLSLPELEVGGLGRPLAENRGQRGRFKVEHVESYQPFTEARQSIYHQGETRANTPTIQLHVEDWQNRAAQLDPTRLTFDFVTPLRLVTHEHLVKQLVFRPLIQRLLERYLALERYYGNQDTQLSREEKESFLEPAAEIACILDQTSWHDLHSYSNRQKRSTPIGGLVGQATFTGDLSPFLLLLVLGELIHVGKNVVKGDGFYRLLGPTQSAQE